MNVDDLHLERKVEKGVLTGYFGPDGFGQG